MSRETRDNLASRAAKGALFLALAVAAALGFLEVFSPEDRPPRLAPFEGYDPSAMQAAMRPERVRAHLDAILAFGPRFIGQPGFYRTEAYIRDAFQAAGLEVHELPVRSAAPWTVRREITSEAGEPLAGVEIYPFLPNHLQPMVTPEEGLVGRLVRVDDEMLATARSFDDCIALVDSSRPPTAFNYYWIKYAQLGFRAVIVAHPEGFDRIDWSALSIEGDARMVASAAVNYVRLAANEAIFRHVGETVRLKVRTEWRNTPNTVLVGVLRGKGPAASAGRDTREALVITSAYDACSILPDASPGTIQAAAVAEQLALLDGIRPYAGDLKRDVLFIAQGSRAIGMDGLNRLLAAVGPPLDRENTLRAIEERLAGNARTAARVDAILGALESPEFLGDAAATEDALRGLAPESRDFFAEEVRYVLNTLVFEQSEEQLQAKLKFLREGPQDVASASFKAYMAAKKVYDEAVSVSGYPLGKLLASRGDFVRRWAVRDRCRERFRELAEYHRARQQELDAARAIHRLFAPYGTTIVASPHLAPADPPVAQGEAMTFYMGEGVEDRITYQAPAINTVLESVMQRAKPPEGFSFVALTDRHSPTIQSATKNIPLDGRFWSRLSYPAFAFVNADRVDAYSMFAWPVERAYMRRMETLEVSLEMMGRCVLSLAFGNGVFKPLIFTENHRHYGGRVFVSGIGTAIVPNCPLAGALIGCKASQGECEKPGWLRHPFYFADPYGRYDVWNCVADFTRDWAPDYSPEAAGFGRDGILSHMKDEGPQGQAIYKSMQISTWGVELDRVNIVTFRCAPVTILDLINPQTMKAYAGAEFITRDGLAEMSKRNTYGEINGVLNNGIITTFVEPDLFFYVKLKAGSPENELVQATRAFLLGVDDAWLAEGAGDPEREIDGPGFLALDHPLLIDVPVRVGRSMDYVNGRRLAVLKRYHMADERTEAFHAKSERLLRESQAEDVSKHAAVLLAREAVTYATLNHPVLRGLIGEAVVGIVWYLGLLVPFVFFLERLLFGFTDIRKQLVAQAAIFLVIFFLLWLLHPAFSMIRSSLMILLGFVILLISGGITVLFWGKFQENLEELKMKRGKVTAAEVNTLGVVATAFMLGLNNMHRRKIRTGLTCATLVLITFAMICFTSVHTDLVDKATPVGKAPYQGFVVKRERFHPILPVEEFGLQTAYGDRFAVVSRGMFVGVQTWEREVYNPEVSVVFEAGGAGGAEPSAAARKVACDSILQLSADEPLRREVRFVTKRGWFPKATPAAGAQDAGAKDAADEALTPVMIPDAVARELGISARAVDAGEVVVKMNGKRFRVHAVFEAEPLAALRDLDGKGILPFDIEGMRNIRRTRLTGHILAEDDDPRISADRVIIAPQGDLGIAVQNGTYRVASIAVEMGGLNYKEARGWIDRFLEQIGQPTFYGLDGVAYFGKRTRESSFGGGLELIIPLVIAALTVLATMRGSVYERQDEIFVYNALGIAPRYVFAMFFAEAFVYSVVGSVLGYVLSQGTGRILTALDWTGGLNMTFTSIRTIYASLAITGAVFLSTWFPARTAMTLSMPAEDAGWKLPEPEGDDLTFDLPFTFDHRDRIAILAFFNRYFLDHGEGGGGPFHSGVPGMRVARGAGAEGGRVPEVSTVIWLKPFDLGVSQQLAISLPSDADTGEFIARIRLTRLSGTREAWMRLNHGFVGMIRRHFLYWRAVGPDERAGMFDEARGLLDTSLVGATDSGG